MLAPTRGRSRSSAATCARSIRRSWWASRPPRAWGGAGRGAGGRGGGGGGGAPGGGRGGVGGGGAGGREVTAEVFAWWGGIDLVVPPDWRVVSEVVPIMGGVDDRTRAAAGTGAAAPIGGGGV